MPTPAREHVQVDAATLARRILADVKHQAPNVALDALLMTTATIIVASLHRDPAEAQRMAAACGRALRDAVGKEARDALAPGASDATTRVHGT